MAERITTPALVAAARDHCRSAIGHYEKPDGDLRDALTAIKAAMCALQAAQIRLEAHLQIEA